MLAQMMGGAPPPPAGGGKIGKTEAVAAFAAAAAAAKRAWTDGKFKAEAEKVLGGTLGDKAVAKMDAFVAKKGLPANSFTLNGILHNWRQLTLRRKGLIVIDSIDYELQLCLLLWS